AFLQRFQKGTLPDDIKELSLEIENKSILLTNMLKNAEMTASTSEAMRLIKQGGVKINSEKVSDVKLEIEKGSEAIYQVGKRKFLKIKIK
ncbi:MAG: tyrosine--tRNA ligase, partial [Proteobacteria bacterium]|nr:tyrosine--tRNA ligase [Pseudomonadota bacterium]